MAAPSPAPKPMKPTPLIRPAIHEDAPEIARLVQRYWEFEKIPGFEFSRIESLLRAFLSDPRSGAGWLAISGGETVGYLLATFVFSLEHGGLMAEIDELFVTPPARSAGVGSALLQTAEAALKQRGCVRIQLQLSSDNAAARKFYRRHGYAERDRYELLDKPLTNRPA